MPRAPQTTLPYQRRDIFIISIIQCMYIVGVNIHVFVIIIIIISQWVMTDAIVSPR